MNWIEIVSLILNNAPTIIKTVEEGIDWVKDTWESVRAAYDQPADQITKEQLLEQLERIKENSERIQQID